MRINLYIKKERVFNYIKSQMNSSGYITQLVEKDMENKEVLDKETVIRLIKEYAGEIKIPQDEGVKESVNDLLDW